VAATENIRIYPIAVGDPTAVGEEAIDLETLGRMAEVTGGRAFEALNSDDLAAVFNLLDTLEPNIFDSVSFRPRTDVHWLPLGLIVALYLMLRMLAKLWPLPRSEVSQ